ncbi:hypothetical protein B0H16DRAFT_1712923 [Mycena metata]|uniref:Uncharacterized protein n=1 Tax=Mycena metata TaxID=1033252 RepID=A0AAD7NUL2_9AGAR|nr:hypothetical protein B0H16DRAFT_1712923 [Mycena metata]
MDLAKILSPIPPALTFKNPCGRAGCDHVLEYAGTNPFQKLANLVAAHTPHCTGHKNSGTVSCETEWQPSEKVLQAVLTDDMYYNFGGFATEVTQDRAFNEAPQPIQWPSYDESDTDDAMSVDSVSSPGGRKRRARTSKPRSAGGLDFTAFTLEAPHKKKGARTEAQRRALLKGDVWTKKVRPHSVDCRGCKQTIKLDGRSRYYPGLWEKHRERCNGVKIGLVEANHPLKAIELPPAVEEATPMNSVDMAPRKSYYRAQKV